MALIGAGWLYLGARALWHSVLLANGGQTLSATVDKIEKSVDYDIDSGRTDDQKHHRVRKNTSFTATISYTDPSGNRQTFEQSVSRIRDQIKEGQAIELAYIAGPPPFAQIKSTVEPWRDLIPIVIGLIFFAIARPIWRFRR